MKICTSCDEEKSLDLFPTANKAKGTKEGKCKKCKAYYKKKWHADNRDYIKNRPAVRWQRSKNAAKRRGKSWNIEKNIYFDLIKKECYYCKGNLPLFGVGLDRLDSGIGYQLDNVVPCCQMCNQGRNEHFTPEEWKIAIKAILEHRRNN